MANSLDGGRRASVDLSFHNGNFRTVDRDGDGGDQHGAEDDTLRKYVDPEERHADAHDGDDQGPGQRAPGTADSPGIAVRPTTTAAIEGSRSSAAKVGDGFPTFTPEA